MGYQDIGLFLISIAVALTWVRPRDFESRVTFANFGIGLLLLVGILDLYLIDTAQPWSSPKKVVHRYS